VARTDLTTGLGDRVALEMAAETQLAKAVRAGRELSVMTVHLPAAADICVRDQHLSIALRASVRAADLLFRYDPDTIVALLPMAGSDGAARVMQRVARLTDRPISYAVATAPGDGRDLETLVDAACRRVQHITF
jgi:GGDEF domain-containing protein